MQMTDYEAKLMQPFDTIKQVLLKAVWLQNKVFFFFLFHQTFLQDA